MCGSLTEFCQDMKTFSTNSEKKHPTKPYSFYYCKNAKDMLHKISPLKFAFRTICVSSMRELKCWVFSLIISKMKYRNHQETTVSETMAFDPWLPAVCHSREVKFHFTLALDQTHGSCLFHLFCFLTTKHRATL